MPVTADHDLLKALAQLQRARHIVFTTHVQPDGDGLGSIAALAAWLRSEGRQVETIVPTPPAPKYAFLDPEGAIRVAGRDVDLASLDRPDLVCVVDTGTWQQLERVRPLVAESGAPVLVIDHHRTRDPLADVCYVDSEVSACAVLVMRLLEEAGVAMTPFMATALLTGLAADTDWFRLPSVGAETFRRAARLIDAGARPHAVYEELFLSEEPAKMRLRALAIESIHPAADGRIRVMRLTRETFRQAGIDSRSTESLINECMRYRGVKVGVLLVEAEGGHVRVSLRGRLGQNVLPVAERFGGGGHVRAAGCKLEGSPAEVEARILEALGPVLAEAGKP